MECKYCRSTKIVKHGKANGKQRYLCKECSHKFIEGSDFPRMRTKSHACMHAKPMRGLKAFESTKSILEGYTVHYNFVRPHQSLKGKTPAQASGINMKSDWHLLVKEATKYDALNTQRSNKPLEVLNQ